MPKNIRPTNLIERIYNDLAAGVVTARTPEEEIYARYGRGPNRSSCWLEYKTALRAYGEVCGTMVIVDDTNGVFLGQMDCTPETTQAEAVRYLDPFAEAHFRNCGQRGPMHVTIYRLPRWDYSAEPYEFFDTRAEYLWSTIKGQTPVPA